MNNFNPKVSIIIPAHNEEVGIHKTLEAILDQEYPLFEIIVIDNASTDKTTEIVKKFPVKLVTELRKGTMWACEKGRKEARGEIIVRADADCIPDKDWLREGVSFFDDNMVVGVSGPYDYFDGPIAFKKISMYMQICIYRAINYILQKIKMGSIMIGGNSFMRADALEKIGGFNTSIVFYGDDTDTARRISKYGKVIFSPKVVMKTSARRFKDEGVIKITLKYFFYFFRVLLSH